ncbi:hypothetical protein FSP39_018183 [Pinctada imbricata]|uniref:Uncharacterized protein n=1 Tax=Pinctada imbricata TaxID=66713 RepID=A0AA88YMX2_PINIB|nr:hypothetical protein FSP39_018183 [Pinctada imbricata]
MEKYRIYGLFLILLSCSEAQDRSVCDQLFSNCKCENGNRIVVCSGLKGFGIFPRPLPVEIVNFTVVDSNLGDIEPSYTDFGKYKHLKNIVIKSSTIRYLQACAISSLNSIDSIIFDTVRIDKIATNAFSHLSNITTLKVENSDVYEIMKFAFHDISNVKTFTVSNVTIDKLDTSSVRDLYEISSIEIKDSRIKDVAYAPLQNITHVDKMRFVNNEIAENFCGLVDISPTNKMSTLRSVEFKENNLKCFKNVTMAIRAFSNRWTVTNNVCNGPDFLGGTKLEDLSNNDAYRTRSTELSVCGASILTYDDHSCQSYKIDQGILAPDQEYVYDDDDKNGSKTLKSEGLFLTITITLVTFISSLYI